MSTVCPPAEVLEALALGGVASRETETHLAHCSDCQRQLQRIRDDNRFLSEFAVNGSLLVEGRADWTSASRIPGYEIIRELHRGGQGVVYQAVQLSTRRDVAIKILRQGPFATLADRTRFEREIETLGRLDHPNIVAIHDAGTAAGFHYFVMDYIAGAALDEWFAGVAFHTRLETFAKVCDAVHAVHLLGIIHRDLKPSNIRVDAAGDPHVLDFGLAKSTDAPADSAMTRTGQFVGSLPWASPEQVQGAASIDLRTDVYSLGAILFQLLTSGPPFELDSSLQESLHRIVHTEPPKPSAVLKRQQRGARRKFPTAPSAADAVGDELDTIALKALSKDPQRRYQSAGELARDLRRFLAGEAIDAKRDSALYVLGKTLKRYYLRVAAASAFVLLVLLFAIVMAVLYARAQRLEHQASLAAASLSELLMQSNIEKGRLAGMLGNLDRAEELLWCEFLMRRAPGGDQTPQLAEPPGSPEAYWALWELYRRYPCLRTLPAPLPTSWTLANDEESLWLVRRDGFLRKLDPWGTTLDAYQAGFSNETLYPVVSADGNLVVTSDFESIRLWRRGQTAPSLEVDLLAAPPFGALFLAPGGDRLAAALGDAVVVWNTGPPTEIARFDDAESGFTAVAISNSGWQLAARDRRGGLHLWDIETRRRIGGAPGVGAADALHNSGALRFSPTDEHVADGWEESAGRIWDLRTKPATFVELSERPGSYRVLAFSPNGRLLALADADGARWLFSTDTGARLSKSIAHPGRADFVAFTRDGRGIWTAGGAALRLWELDEAGSRSLAVDGEAFHSVEVTLDGQAVLAAGNRGELQLLDATSLTRIETPYSGTEVISSVACARDGRRIAASTYGNAALLWNDADFAHPPQQLAHPNRVSHVAFSPDGARLATACDDRVVRVWQCAGGSLEHEFRDSESRVPQVAFDSTGRLLIAVGRNGALYVWNIETCEREMWSASPPSQLRALAISPDGACLATGGAQRSVEIWDFVQRRCVATLVGHTQEIFSLAISPDGQLLASGDAGGVIRLWHATLHRPLAMLTGHSERVMALRFSPNGAALFSAALDGTVRRWDLEYHRQHVSGNLPAQLARVGADEADPQRAAAWRAWARRVGPPAGPPDRTATAQSEAE